MAAWGGRAFSGDVMALLEDAEGPGAPAPWQRVRCARLLMSWHRPETLPAGLRARLIARLSHAPSHSAGEAGLMLTLLDRPRGLGRLRAALDDDIPSARSEAAGALALLGMLGVGEAAAILERADGLEARSARALMTGRDVPAVPPAAGEIVEIAGRPRRGVSIAQLLAAQAPTATLRAAEALMERYRAILVEWG